MALSLRLESEKHDEFQAGLMRSGGNRGYIQQRDRYTTGSNSSLSVGHGPDSKYYNNMADVTNHFNRQHPNAANDKYFSGYKNGQLPYALDNLHDTLGSYGLAHQDGGYKGNGSSDQAYYCPWNMDGPTESALPPGCGTGRDTTDAGVDCGLNAAERFGLSSSTVSTGFGALDDLVSKIVEDDQSLFSSFNGMVDSRTGQHEMNGFDRCSNVNFNSVWSMGGDGSTSTPAGKPKAGFDCDSVEPPPRPSDYLWDTSGSGSSGSFLQDGSFLDSLYSTPGASSSGGDGSPSIHPQQQHHHKQHNNQQQQQAAKERFRYTKHLYNKSDYSTQREFDQNDPGDVKMGGDRYGYGDGSSNPYFTNMMYDMMKCDADPGTGGPMHNHHMPAGGPAGASQQDVNMSGFPGGSVAPPSNLDVAWTLANLPEIPGIDKHLLAQALMSQASNALLNAEMASGKNKLLDSLMQLSEKAQQEREGGASGPSGGGSGGSLVQPIRVMTQQNNNNTSYHNGAAASVSTWSNPGTPNSGTDSTAPSGPKTPHANMAQGRRAVHMFPQKGFPNKISPQNGPRGAVNNHSQMPTSFEKRPGSSCFQGPSPPGGCSRGRGMPFPFPRKQRHVCDPSGDAKPGPDRFPSGPFPVPDHLSGAVERGTPPFPKEFPGGMPHHHRSHFIEDLFPHDYAGLPPFPSHLKHPHNLPPHLPPEAYEYFPYDPYFQGCLTPTFLRPNDMFFDMLPPQFYGLPHFFPGFKPPRRTGPSNELHIRLEECYDQFKNLERERKKTEAELARQNPGKKVSSANSIVIPRLPSNPSRVDRLVVDSLREHARVLTLILKMEKLRGGAMHANIHSTMDTWMEGIRKVQARRKEEIINATNRHRNGGPRYQEEKDVLALATSINELTTHTRRSRTSMWCALQTSMKDVPTSSLHHLWPSELAAHDAANQHSAAPKETTLTTAAPIRDVDGLKPVGTALSPVLLNTEKKADDNNNAQPADATINAAKVVVPQVK